MANLARPKVLQVITKLDLGGAETVSLDLIDALRSRFDFAVFAAFEIPQPSQVGQGMARRLQSWGVPFWSGTSGHFKKGGVFVAAWRLAQTVRRFRPDVVHLHTEVPELTYAVATVLAPSLRRVPVLRTVHNCELWIAWGGIGRWVTERLGRSHSIAVSHAAADADAAIATSRARTRASIMPNGVEPPPIVPAPLAGRPFRLLFAARLVDQKAPDLLPAILSHAYARSGRRDVEVVIAGSGPLEDDLRRDLEGVASDWTIRIVPPIDGLRMRFGDFDAVLMPSRFEGLGLLAIEALMAGLPLVATDAPGLSEALPAGYRFLAAVDDSEALGGLVADIMDDPGAARAYVAPLRLDLIERFSPQKTAERYAAAFEELAQTG